MGSGVVVERLGADVVVETRVGHHYMEKQQNPAALRRVGLLHGPQGRSALQRLRGPAEGVLPGALSSMPDVALKTLNINLAELIFHLRGRDDEFAQIPLAEMVRDAE